MPPVPPPPVPPLPPPPHPREPKMKKSNTSTPRAFDHLHRRAGMPMSKTQATGGPPTNDHKSFLAGFKAELAAVVFTVRVIVCAVQPLMVAELGRLHVAGSLAAVGVIAQLREIAPVNPPDAVKLIVDVFPVVAPGATLTAVPVMEKLGAGAPGEMV